MYFRTVSHACLEIGCKGKVLLTDPWLVGSCYWRVRQPQLLVTQEGKAGSEPRLVGCLNDGRVDGDNCQSAVREFGRLMELDQFRQLKLSLGSPRAAEEGQDQRPAFCKVRDRNLALAVIQ